MATNSPRLSVILVCSSASVELSPAVIVELYVSDIDEYVRASCFGIALAAAAFPPFITLIGQFELVDVATIARRQEFPGEDFIRRRCALEIVGVDDDIDAFLQAGVIDVADTDLLGFRRGDFDVHRRDQVLQFDLGVEQRLTFQRRLDAHARVGEHIFEALRDRPQEAGHRLGILLDEILRDDDGIAVQVQPEVAVLHHVHFLARVLVDLAQAKPDRIDVAGNGVDVAAHQHLLAQARLHVLPVDFLGINAGCFRKGGEQLERRVVNRRAERLAFELLRRGDVLVLHRVDRERRNTIKHEHGFRRVFRMLGREDCQRVDVAEADIVGPACYARDRRARPFALVHLDVEAFGFEISFVLGDEEPRLRALVLPIEDEADLHRIRRRSWRL